MFFKNLKSKILDFLNSQDKYEEPVQFNLKGEPSTKSTLGGTISFIITLFLLYQIIIQSVGMFKHNSQQIVQMNEFQNDPESALLTQDNNFWMGISTRFGNSFINMSKKSVISFKAFYIQQYLSDSGPKDISGAEVLWAPCNKSDFSPPIYPENLYQGVRLNYGYCARGLNFTSRETGVCQDYIQEDYPDCITPPDFKVQGTLFSASYEFIKIVVTLCDPDDARTISGLKCSPNALNETLDNQGVFMHFGFGNSYIDPNNYTTPNQTFADFLDWNLHPRQSRTASIYVDTETIEDFDNFLLQDVSNKRKSYSISADKMREQQLTPREYLLEATIQRSKLNRYTTRTYVKLFDVFSNVGGLSGTVILIGSFLALGYSQYKHFLVLSNEVYDFEKEQETVATKKLARNCVADISIENKSHSNSQIEMVPSQQKQSKMNMNEYFDSLTSKKKLEYNELTYIKGMLSNLFRKKNPHEQLAQKAKKKVIKDLDVCRIMKKMKEVDKLKMLLLNPTQLEAFNFVKNPVITLGTKKPKYFTDFKCLVSTESPTLKPDNSNASSLKQNMELSEYEKLYLVYKQMKEDKNSENSKLNEKIISMIDKDIINAFNQMKNQNKSILNSRNLDQSSQDILEKSRIKSVTDL